MALIYEKLTYEIHKGIFYVHNHIGFGFDEDTYHQGLKAYFSQQGIPYKSHDRGILEHRGKNITVFEYDLLINNLVILELKAVQYKFTRDHFRQIIEYLKFWKKDLGILINFGFEWAGIERVPFTEKKKLRREEYNYIKNKLSAVERKELSEIRNAILEVYQLYGLGYRENIYNELLKVEFDYRGILWQGDWEIPIFLDNVFLKNFKMPFILVNNKYIIGVISIHDNIRSLDIARMTTYLRKLKLHFGLMVNFGKHELQINGVYTD